MSSDIISLLQLDKESPGSGRLLIAKEVNNCDSTFLISCILGHCIKTKSATLVVALHNTQPHFQNVGIKMNYNLERYVNSGLISFYNVGQEFVNSLLINEQLTLDKIFLGIKERMHKMKENYSTVNVIIDGISHLFDMRFSLREVNKFCRDVIKLFREDSSFILLHTNVALEDDVTAVMSNLLCHMADFVISVESLSSGWSADVSGHLTLSHPGKKFEPEHMFNMDLKPSRYLFKLFDRGVKLFAPGTV